MSLVAYASSDDASSDDDEPTESPAKAKITTKPTGSFLSSLPQPKTQTKTSFLGLPPPKNQGSSTVDVQPKKTLSSLPPPKKNAVKIALPELPDLDSDEEEEEPSKKRPKTSGLLGLMSRLPQPKGVVTKETKRPLIPHTLTKRPTPKPVTKPKTNVTHKKSTTPKPFVSGVDSDDDDDDENGDGVNFFSFGESSASTHDSTSVPAAVSSAPTTTASATPDINELDPRQFQPGSDNTVAPHTETDSALITEGGADYMSGADAPLVFKGGKTSQTGPQSYLKYSERNVYGAYESQYYGSQSSEVSAHDYSNQLDVNQYLQDEQFLKMQGKRHRGKEEINIIDVSAADQMATEIQMTRGLSEEGAAPPPKKNKDDGPSSQQKKKHQITYLAHQAKEREFELRNQWASNSATKKQTQAKYGF